MLPTSGWRVIDPRTSRHRLPDRHYNSLSARFLRLRLNMFTHFPPFILTTSLMISSSKSGNMPASVLSRIALVLVAWEPTQRPQETHCTTVPCSACIIRYASADSALDCIAAASCEPNSCLSSSVGISRRGGGGGGSSSSDDLRRDCWIC